MSEKVEIDIKNEDKPEINLLTFHEQYAGRLIIDPAWVLHPPLVSEIHRVVRQQRGEDRARRGRCSETQIIRRWNDCPLASTNGLSSRSAELEHASKEPATDHRHFGLYRPRL